ncbi:MAG: PQQ-binding-like beta-propeller repeat protein [bacterium]|nr:PQQ-binding-like beta-propeller repeat protein [bacterium]
MLRIGRGRVFGWVVALGAVVTISGAVAGQGDWPSFRGTRAAGVAPGAEAPTSWDMASGTNIAWKTAIPGLGHSSPVIWGDKLFVTTAISGKKKDSLRVGLYGDIKPVNDSTIHRFIVYCLDKKTGKILWEKTAHEGVPAVKRHTKATHANATPATDGKHLAVLFGSEGLYVYDMQGKLLWKKDLGVLDAGFFRVPEAQWEYGSSPIVHDGRVIVLCDVQGDSFIAAFDVETGKELWRTARDEVPTWGSPTVVESEGRTQVVVNGWKHIGGYDMQTGKELWRMTGGGDIPVPTPVVGHGLIFVTNAHGGMAPIYAIRPGAEGDVSLKDGASSNDHVAWSHERDGAYMQTPLVYGDHLYVCRDNGLLSCIDAKSGAVLWKTRVGGGGSGFTASMVATAGKVYVTSETGDIHVFEPGAEYNEVAVNALDEVTMATPAISDGTLYFRTRGHVVAVAEKK